MFAISAPVTADSDTGSVRRPKIGLAGSGSIGSILGVLIGEKRLGDVALLDIAGDVSKGKSLDLTHSSPCRRCDSMYTASDKYEVLEGCDVVIVSAGVPRKPWMKREDTLEVNSKVIKEVAAGISKYCPDAFVINITNPLDAMAYLLQKESKLPPNKVVGMAGVLDSNRFRYFLSERLGVSVENISALVIGQHSDVMVPLPRYTTVGGIALPELISMGWLTQEEVDAIVKRTQHGGAEIVDFLKTGSAFFAPASSAIEMAEAYLLDRKSLLPCSALLDGQYGVKGLYVGVPVVIGRNGVERIVELKLTAEERKEFNESVKAIKDLVDAVAKVE